MPAAPNGRKLTSLGEKLAARIAASGSISFHEYIESCLYDPEYGYYRRKAALGRKGDFITAPEISQVFGELIGLWAGSLWQQMGEPGPLRLIELGPGRGTLMSDALRALRVLPGFFEKATVHLVEMSEPLRQAQKVALSAREPPIFWHESLDDVPAGVSIVIANEFFDCLPVRQYAFDGELGCWRERMVTLADGTFKFVLGEKAEIGALGADKGGEGAIFEYRPSLDALTANFAARAADAPFAALIIDYGYCAPAMGDTVQAVRGHHYVDVLVAPGEADITAHVDFTHIKRAAVAERISFDGPMPLGEWLLRLGLEARVKRLLEGCSSEEASKELVSGVRRLVDPAQMGILFKVAVLSHGLSTAPPPFSHG